MTRILIIDDDEDVRDALQMILQRAGHQVVTARTGDEALELQRRDPARIVITDIIMPEKDGVAVMKEMRLEFPQARIIAISGGGGIEPSTYQPEAVATSAYLAAAKQAGADRVFTKPFDRELILQAVDELLALH